MLRKYSLSAGLACIVLLITGRLVAQTLPADVLEKNTLQKIEAFDQSRDGVLGVAALDLTTHRVFSYHGEVIFPQASSIKIPILIEMFKQDRAGKIHLPDTYEITKKDLVGGSGRYRLELEAGKTLRKSLQDIIRAMIVWSDNVATNVCIRLVGMQNINRTLKQMGFVHTRLQRLMMDGAAVQRNDENISTPLEMVRLVQKIYENDVVDAEACTAMLEILAEVEAGMRAAVPAAYRVAAKPGSVPGVRCETGIVFLENRPFALSVMSTFNGQKAGTPVPAITEIVFDYFERLAHSNVYGHRVTDRPAGAQKKQ